VQYRIQCFLHDPTISTLPINQTHQAAEEVVVQDAQRRMAAQLQAFDIVFNNTAVSGSGNTPNTIDDSSSTEASSDDSTADADDESADDEESESG
jgi:hypothetical protein